MSNVTNYNDFINNAKDPLEWFKLAEELNYSASIIKEKWDSLFDEYALSCEKNGVESDETLYIFMDLIGVEKTYNFLMGLAIENLIKGKLIEYNPEKVSFIAKVNPNNSEIIEPIRIEYGWSHNLSELAKSLCNVSKLALTEKQENALVYLSETIIWGGRYPAPVSLKTKTDDPLMALTGNKSNEIPKIFNKIYRLKIKGKKGRISSKN